MLYRSGSIDRARKRLRDSRGEIDGVHQLIWPFHPVPRISKKQQHGNDEVVLSAMVTSYFFTMLVYMFRSLKRSPQDRAIAAKVLRFFMEKLLNTTVEVLQFHEDGSHIYRDVDIDLDGCVPDCWTEQYCEHVGALWDKDLMSTKKPWIQSPRQKPLFADFVLFCLEPVPVKATNRRLKTVKSQLVRTGLYLMSQIAEKIDSRIFGLTQKPDQVRLRVLGGKRRRDSTLEANATAAECADLLFTKQEGSPQ